MDNDTVPKTPEPPEFQGMDGPAPSSAVQVEVVRKHLENVIGSAEMRRSKKLCQFLRFTVEEVLRGHGRELKEYAIAVGVFRRGREFDTGSDPIVRVQARRLRSKLEQYYRSEGRDEQIRIEFPVGSYSPVFLARPQQAWVQAGSAIAPAPKIGLPILVAVLPFVGIGVEGDAFGEGLTDELMHQLSGAEAIRVVARSSCFQFRGRSEDVRRIGEALGVSALVSGSVRIEGAHLRVLAQLVDTGTGVNLWSSAYDRKLESALAAQLEISREVAGAVISVCQAILCSDGLHCS
jgi:TolB-like protein